MLGEKALSDMDARAFAKVQPAMVKALALLNSKSSPPGIYQIAETVRQALDPTKSWLDPDTAAILKLFLNKNMLAALQGLSDQGAVAVTLEKERGQVEAVQTSISNGTNFSGLEYKAVNNLIATSTLGPLTNRQDPRWYCSQSSKSLISY